MARPDPAMGLMMGSLLPMGWWCASAGWSGPQSLTLHLCAMVAGAWLACHLAGRGWHGLNPAWAWAWAGAALLSLQGSPAAMLAAAALVAAGSTLCTRARTGTGTGAWALSGCGLLLAVGHWSATWGPDALRLALLLAVLLTALGSLPSGRNRASSAL